MKETPENPPHQEILMTDNPDNPTEIPEATPELIPEPTPEPEAAKRRRTRPRRVRESSVSSSGDPVEVPPTPRGRTGSVTNDLQQIQDGVTAMLALAGTGVYVASGQSSATGLILMSRAADGGEIARKLALQDERVRRALMLLLKGSTYVEAAMFLSAIGIGIAVDTGALEPNELVAMLVPELKDLPKKEPQNIVVGVAEEPVPPVADVTY